MPRRRILRSTFARCRHISKARALLSQLTIRAIKAAAGTRLMLHAGVADADGRVVAPRRPSGMGKTTASVYLSRHGFGYVTDETVSIGRDGDVLPFGRPLSLRRPVGEIQKSPDELGMGVPSGDLSIARIVLLDRAPGQADPPTLTAVPLVDALLELIPQASALAKLPDPLRFMSRVVDRCGGVLRLTYGDMDERVLSCCRTPCREVDAPDLWQAFMPQPRSTDELAPERAAMNDQRLFQASSTASRPTRRHSSSSTKSRCGSAKSGSPSGRPPVTASPAPRSCPSWSRRMVHPDAPRIVREAVDQMLEAGLLVAGAAELL